MAKNEDDIPAILSTDEARAGVTGHHVKYVLAFGLLGSLIAFTAIGLYYGYGTLTETLVAIFGVRGTLAERLVAARRSYRDNAGHGRQITIALYNWGVSGNCAWSDGSSLCAGEVFRTQRALCCARTGACGAWRARLRPVASKAN